MELVHVRALRGFRAPVGSPPEFRTVVAGEAVHIPALLAREMAASNKVEPIEDPVPVEEPVPATMEQTDRPRRGRPPKGD